MKTKISMISVVILCMFCLILTGCGCEHEFGSGVVTAEPTCTSEGVMSYTCSLCGQTKVESIPMTEHIYESEVIKDSTFSETGEKKYTCSFCGDSYTETMPMKDEPVVVTVTGKANLSKDYDAGRYSDRVEFSFSVKNVTDKSIKGVQGVLTIMDLFGADILNINCDFTGQTIPANSTVDMSDLGFDINQFNDYHTKLYDTDFSDLNFAYEVKDVVFENEQSVQTVSGTDNALSEQHVIVTVTNKTNLSENWNAGRYSPRVEFEFSLTNTTDKDIKGVQGILIVKDLFGKDILSSNCDFTGKTIPAKGTISVSGLGMDINQFKDEHVKLYSEDYSDLNFEYTISSIVYTDGTVE